MPRLKISLKGPMDYTDEEVPQALDGARESLATCESNIAKCEAALAARREERKRLETLVSVLETRKRAAELEAEVEALRAKVAGYEAARGNGVADAGV